MNSQYQNRPCGGWHDYDIEARLKELEDIEEVPEEETWCPEPELFEDLLEMDIHRKRASKILAPALPSEFTEFAFRMPSDDGTGYVPFSFNGRRHMYRIYNTPARRILLVCGRQVEKSTMLGNSALSYSCLVTGHRTLYVSPSATQTKTFSADRVKEPLETSPILKTFTMSSLQQNIFEKQFVNRSKITLRYAFLNADRTRGIPAWRLLLDELQDILADNIPVIEQCTSHAPEQWKRFIYAGTPKSTDNVIEYYRSGTTKDGKSMSTMGEWVVPCDAHGGEGGRYWNILGEKNIGKKGLICEKCGKRINSMHPDSQWAMQVADGVFESYRIPQLMVPWKPWEEILLDYGRYARDKFYNEVLGISFDSGLRPLSRQQVRECCLDEIRMSQEALRAYRALGAGQPIFAGIDWGTGENTYTVMTLGTYVRPGKFRIFYVHRFSGEDVDPEPQMRKICEVLKYFNVRVIGTDYGGGFHPNDILARTFGRVRLQKYQYVAKAKKKVFFNQGLGRWQVSRTEVMSDIFNAIKRKMFELPRWEEFREPYAEDMVNIFSEYNETLRMIKYDHRPDKPDDTFHSILYCFLASMLMIPRPDIITPSKEDPTRGPVFTSYNGPVDQG